MTGTKDAIRREMISLRRAVSPLDAEAAERALVEHVRALAGYRRSSALIAYAAMDGEVATDRLIRAAFADGKRVFLPVVRGSEMTFAEHRPGAVLTTGRFGIPEAAGEDWTAAAGSTLALVPLVAWDRDGVRLGRGGGFYDRAFAARGDQPRGVSADVVLVGLAYAFQQCAKVPRDTWDVLLDWVVCERGPVRCRDGDDRSPIRKEDTTQHGFFVDCDLLGFGRRAGVRSPARAPE